MFKQWIIQKACKSKHVFYAAGIAVAQVLTSDTLPTDTLGLLAEFCKNKVVQNTIGTVKTAQSIAKDLANVESLVAKAEAANGVLSAVDKVALSASALSLMATVASLVPGVPEELKNSLGILFYS